MSRVVEPRHSYGPRGALRVRRAPNSAPASPRASHRAAIRPDRCRGWSPQCPGSKTWTWRGPAARRNPSASYVTRSHVTSWYQGTGRRVCPGPGNVLRSSGVSAPELWGLGPLRGYDQVVDPHGLIDGRTPPDVGPVDYLVDLEAGPVSRHNIQFWAADGQMDMYVDR